MEESYKHVLQNSIDDHDKAREVCSTIYWMRQSKMDFSVNFRQRDFEYCEAIAALELYTYQALFSKEALQM